MKIYSMTRNFAWDGSQDVWKYTSIYMVPESRASFPTWLYTGTRHDDEYQK